MGAARSPTTCPSSASRSSRSGLTEPPSWIFRLGVAYPLRARISGEGAGAIRRCEFSTGAFVVPITTWSPPNRLAFDVTSQPLSMTESADVDVAEVGHWMRGWGDGEVPLGQSAPDLPG
jgi:hypothetical protein